MRRHRWRHLRLRLVFGLVCLSCAIVPAAHAIAATTIVAWGDNGYGQTDVPAGLSNITAIAAGEVLSIFSFSELLFTAYSIENGRISMRSCQQA